MHSFVVIACIGLVSAARADLPHNVFEKSFETSLQECAEYFEISNCTLQQYKAERFPNTPVVRRLIYCTMANLKAWYSAFGLYEPQMRLFFKPSPTDSCYQNTTQECLNSVPGKAHLSDVTSLAYESFQCYYCHYGNIVESAQFIPNTWSEFDRILKATFDYLELPEETLVQFCKGNISNNARFPEIVYIVGVRTGYYSLASGARLDRLYIGIGEEALAAPETKQCVDRVSSEYCKADVVTKVHQIYVQCLDSVVPLRQQIQLISKKRVSNPALCGCACV